MPIINTPAESAIYDAGYFKGKEEGQSNLSKLASISLLEEKLANLEHHNQTLLVHNNELLARARKAEAALKETTIQGWPKDVPESLTC
jgi:hypothetical protein